jgi:hypothetical protein
MAHSHQGSAGVMMVAFNVPGGYSLLKSQDAETLRHAAESRTPP